MLGYGYQDIRSHKIGAGAATWHSHQGVRQPLHPTSAFKQCETLTISTAHNAHHVVPCEP